MKTVKRVFSLVLTIIMLASSLDLATLHVAAAENTPSVGTVEVPPDPEEYLTLGEWVYWIEEDQAYIAGYKNVNETTLTIPGKLGRYPVVGIGAEAFCENTALESVQIHTNVTAIAKDAFAGLDITIRAYHGSFALRYADLMGLKKTNLTVTAVYVENVIDLTGLSSQKVYSGLCDTSVSFSVNEASFLAVGQILRFPSQPGYPTGVAKRVDAVFTEDGFTRVLLSQPDWAEVFDTVQGEEELYADLANAEWYEDVILTDDVSVASPTITLGNIAFGVELPSLKVGGFSGGVKLSYNIAKPKVTYEVKTKWPLIGLPHPELKILNVNMPIDNKFEGSIGYKKDYGSNNSKNPDKAFDEIKIGKIPIISVSGVINGYIEAGLKIELSGEVKFTATSSYTLNVSVNNGKLSTTRTNGRNTKDVSAAGKFKFGPYSKFYMVLGIDGFNLRFFEASIGVYLVVEGKVTYTYVTGSRDGIHCGDISAKVVLEAGIKAGAIEVEVLKEKLKLNLALTAEYKWDLLTIGSVHIEKWKIPQWSLGVLPIGGTVIGDIYIKNTGSCSLKNRKIVFEYGSVGGKKTAEAVYNVNQKVSSPPALYVDGYKLTGWKVDTAKSGLPGNDYDFRFGYDLMPYIENGGTFYLYAVWADMYPPTSFSLNKTSIEGLSKNGETVQLQAQNFKPDKTKSRTVKWSTSNRNVADVDSNGKVTLINAGTATITASIVGYPEVKATCKVTVRQSVTGIKLNNTGITRYSDNLGTVQLTQTVTPSNAYNKNVTWKSTNTKVATVSDTGLVTLKGVGEAEIICASVSNPKVKGTCKVTIHQAVTGIELDKSSVQITNADMLPIPLKATVSPANAYNKSLTWESSNPAVATVSASGVVTPKALGKAVITCRSVSSPKITASFTIEVVQAVTAIKLNESSVTRYSDEKNPIQLVPTVMPEDAYNKSVTWETNNPKVVTVSNTGAVTVVAAGNATVICRSVSNPNVTAECSFNILQAVTDIKLFRENVETNNVESTTDEINPTYLTCAVYPADAYNKAVVWSSSNEEVAEVTPDGIVTIKGEGTAEIRCTSVSQPYISGVCTVRVELAVRDMKLSESSIVCYSGQDDVQLIAYIDGVPNHDRGLTWTADNPAAASVSDSGIVKINGLGESLITCTSQSNTKVSAQCLVTVLQSVEEITLNEHSITRDSNHLTSVQLSAAVAPANAANKQLIWESSNPDVAAVSDEGTILFAGAGTAVITCRSVTNPNVTDSCTITINQVVSAVALNYEEFSVYSNEEGTVQLTAYVMPYHASNRAVTWSSSNSSVISVSDSGELTINGIGTAVVTCASVSNPEISAQCTVHVLQEVTGITLDQTQVSLFSNAVEPVQLSADIQPANAADKTLVWSSSDENVVSVTDDGLVTVCGLGTAVVSCYSVTNVNAAAECTFTVNQEAESILLNADSLECYNDGDITIQLTANVQPSNTGNKSVTWTSSNQNVATISSEGLITVVGVGTATISCTSKSNPEVVSTVALTVKQPMTGITLDAEQIELRVSDNEGVQLTAAIAPSNIADTDVIWESSNNNVAVVTDDGLVVAVTQGEAEIYCRSQRRPEEIFAVCSVTVKTDVQAVVIESDVQAILPGETMQLTAVCLPSNADVKDVVWSSENTNIATVDQNGLVTGVAYGTVDVKAVATDGSGVVGSFAVIVEHPLTVETDIINSTVFAQGNINVDLAAFYVSAATARRVVEGGKSLTWSLQKQNDSTDVALTILNTIVTEAGMEYTVPYAVLSGSDFGSEGTKIYTVTCTDGTNTVSEEFVLTVDGGTYAATVAVKPSTFFIECDEIAVIPAVPDSTDGALIPEDTYLTSISGDSYFTEHATVEKAIDGMWVSFDESGVYTAVAQYECANITYSVNLTFYVRDSDGIVHMRTTDVVLDQNTADLVQGETLTLKYQVLPADAYDSSVIWESSDESIVRVDDQGVVTAVAPGFAAITCTTVDGSGASAMCAFTVERFLQLDESNVTYTVYTGGESRADLGIINVTWESEKRLVDAGLNVTWTLQKLDGNACEIGIEEFRANAEEGITVSGDLIKLLRINGSGTDNYLLTCRAGSYEENCHIHINVVDASWNGEPELVRSAYAGAVGETICVDTSYICGGTSLPEGTDVNLVFGRTMESALASEYDVFDPMNLTFAKPGTYTAEVKFSGPNYCYTCPVTFTISDENGNIPLNVKDLRIEPDRLYLFAGESVDLTGIVEPANAPHSSGTWSAQDSSVATVSKTGTVTAISAGETFITYSIPEYDSAAGCYVVIEDGLTLETESVERTVFTDGITRTRLDTVRLTIGSSNRLTEEPVWTLSRVSGNNLTLRAVSCNTVDEDGNTIYGCALNLYSLSREGDTVYELTCSAGGETVSVPVVVHAVSQSRNLPAAIVLKNSSVTAGVNELISVVPEVTCLPEGTHLPDGIRVSLEGDSLFQNSRNTEDSSTSQSMFTVSFSRAGLYTADLVYSYSNMSWRMPVTFRIHDEAGNVPILPASMELSAQSVWLVRGEQTQLSAVFTPANADNRNVTWTSTNPSVATVDSEGNVKALKNGIAYIVCTPADPYLQEQRCRVAVEDYLTMDISDEWIELYKQGTQSNELFSAVLSKGTVDRLEKAGISPQWSVARVSGTNTLYTQKLSGKGDTLAVFSTALLSGGTDVYRVTCTAGAYTESAEFTVEVLDLPGTAETIRPKDANVNIAVGETAVIDFTPVCSPAGSTIPMDEGMFAVYMPIGEQFYNAIDRNVYTRKGDLVTVRFTQPGKYLLAREYVLGNLYYSEVCEINVGKSAAHYGLLQADTTDTIVYLGGTTGTIAKVALTDMVIDELFADDITWNLEHISGSSMKAVLKLAEDGAELVASDALKEGKDVWRVTCSFGDYSESVDIHVEVQKARSAIPAEVSLAVSTVSGMSGDWLSMPIAAVCSPAGSALPEEGDSFWSFEPNGMAADVCRWKIEDGMLKLLALTSGYYTGTLNYQAGSFRYSFPICMTITDEEGVLNAPALDVQLAGVAGTVYRSGSVGVPVGTVELSRAHGSYYRGEAEAYLNGKQLNWQVRVVSGTAAALSIRSNGVNSAEIVLDKIQGVGEITYAVSCKVDGKTVERTGKMIVSDSTADLPDPTLSSRVYYAQPGEIIRISTKAYDKRGGSILQSSTSWNPGELLEVVGNSYEVTSDEITTVFYQEGTYESKLIMRLSNLTFEVPFTAVISRASGAERKLMKMPAALTEIGESAFAGCHAEVVDLRNTKIETIESKAFDGCIDMTLIYIPSSVKKIADDAFYGCLNLTIVCPAGSSAEAYASAHGIAVCLE